MVFVPQLSNVSNCAPDGRINRISQISQLEAFIAVIDSTPHTNTDGCQPAPRRAFGGKRLLFWKVFVAFVFKCDNSVGSYAKKMILRS